jgi:APA family basic amino acid/polyamine antiporter
MDDGHQRSHALERLEKHVQSFELRGDPLLQRALGRSLEGVGVGDPPQPEPVRHAQLPHEALIPESPERSTDYAVLDCENTEGHLLFHRHAAPLEDIDIEGSEPRTTGSVFVDVGARGIGVLVEVDSQLPFPVTQGVPQQDRFLGSPGSEVAVHVLARGVGADIVGPPPGILHWDDIEADPRVEIRVPGQGLEEPNERLGSGRFIAVDASGKENSPAVGDGATETVQGIADTVVADRTQRLDRNGARPGRNAPEAFEQCRVVADGLGARVDAAHAGDEEKEDDVLAESSCTHTMSIPRKSLAGNGDPGVPSGMRSNLKRTIGLGALVGIEVGQSVGAGIFALAGLALAYTGPSLYLAFLMAAVPVIVSMAVLAMLGSGHPTTGGTYVYGSRYFSKSASFLGVWGYVLGALLGAFPLYALTGAQFLQAVIPGLPIIPVALALLTVFYLTNLFGVRVAMGVQAGLVAVMLVALLVFVGVGTVSIDLGNFSPLFTGGVGGFLTASAILTFTVLGANSAVELGDEIINPGKNLPRSFVISLPIVVLLYVAIAVVTAGNVGPSPGGDTSLATLASGFLSGLPLSFFLVGGGFVAVVTTLNATYLWGTKSLIVIAEDGFFPMGVAAVNKRFGTPHWLLTIVFLISALSLVAAGARVEIFAVFASIGGILIFLPVMVGALRFRRIAPERYAAASYKLTGVWYWVAPWIGIVLSLVIIAILLVDLFSHEAGGLYLGLFVLWMVAGGVYAWWAARRQSISRGSTKNPSS